MIIFHGGCLRCQVQILYNDKWEEICYGCCFFESDWGKPDNSIMPPTKEDKERERIKKLMEERRSNEEES